MKSFDVNEIFDLYTENKNLTQADIFHLYDTGESCMKDDSGYHDARHFRLVAYNTDTMEKKDCGIHDGITPSYGDDLPVAMLRVYADGSFFIRFKRVVGMVMSQNVLLTSVMPNA